MNFNEKSKLTPLTLKGDVLLKLGPTWLDWVISIQLKISLNLKPVAAAMPRCRDTPL